MHTIVTMTKLNYLFLNVCDFQFTILSTFRGHSGTVAAQSPPTSEACSSNPGLCVENLVVAY